MTHIMRVLTGLLNEVRIPTYPAVPARHVSLEADGHQTGRLQTHLDGRSQTQSGRR